MITKILPYILRKWFATGLSCQATLIQDGYKEEIILNASTGAVKSGSIGTFNFDVIQTDKNNLVLSISNTENAVTYVPKMSRSTSLILRLPKGIAAINGL